MPVKGGKHKRYRSVVFTEPIPPLPYHPALKHSLFSATAVLLFTYIELIHPAKPDPSAAQDSPEWLFDDPIRISVRELCEALQWHSRTIRSALSRICARFKSEDAFLRAKRAGRGFFVARHFQSAQFKPYALVGGLSDRPNSSFLIYRNPPRIADILRCAAISHHSLTHPPDSLVHNHMNEEIYATSLIPKGLAEILARASVSCLGDLQKKQTLRWEGNKRAEHGAKMRKAWERRKKKMKESKDLG